MQSIRREGEVYVLARSEDRALKESFMRRGQLLGLSKDLKVLREAIRLGRVRQASIILQRPGRFEERWAGAWKYLRGVEYDQMGLQ